MKILFLSLKLQDSDLKSCNIIQFLMFENFFQHKLHFLGNFFHGFQHASHEQGSRGRGQGSCLVQGQTYSWCRYLKTSGSTSMGEDLGSRFRFICCFTSRSTARVILRRVVYGWRNQCILVGQDSAL